jgi:hypothetical protein
MDSELGAGVAYVSPLLIGAYLLSTLSAGVFFHRTHREETDPCPEHRFTPSSHRLSDFFTSRGWERNRGGTHSLSIRASLGRRGWPLARLPLPRGSFALPAPGRMPSYKCPSLQSPHQSRIGATQQTGHHASLFFTSIPSFLSFPLFLLLSSTPSLCFTS